MTLEQIAAGVSRETRVPVWAIQQVGGKSRKPLHVSARDEVARKARNAGHSAVEVAAFLGMTRGMVYRAKRRAVKARVPAE